MSEKYVLSLDQGTTSSRAAIFGEDGKCVVLAKKELTQVFPRPGWVEHQPEEIWQSQMEVAREAIEKLASVVGTKDDALKCIKAIGVSNQRETIILWDRLTGKPLFNAIVWQDKRTADECEALLRGRLRERVREKTGLIIDSYFSATKLSWLLDYVPEARDRAERGHLACGTVDSWLIWNLTAGRIHATDASNASRTLLFNIHTLDWDDELLKLFRIPKALMPAIIPSAGVISETNKDIFGAPVPIAGIAGDQQAAMFGQGCFEPGMAKCTYGTGGFMLMNTGTLPVRSRNRLLTTVAWQGPPGLRRTAYCLEGAVFMAGATVQWLRDGLGIIRTASDIESLASAVEDSGDVYLVPAFAGLGAPYWDGHARGALVGLTRGTTKSHIARAALESIALQTAEVFLAMSKDAGIPVTQLRVDGGASTNDLLMQLQSDYLGVPVERPALVETTALGVARLAGLATGVWSGPDDFSLHRRIDRRFEPRLNTLERDAKLARWRKAVGRSRSWASEHER